MNPDEIADVVTAMTKARMTGDSPGLINIINDLLTGPTVDALNVALVLAGILAEDLGDDPEDGFHWVEVSHIEAPGEETEGSADDLPGHVATFVRMVVAIANGDRATARDLFLGYVDKDGRRALALLVLALNEVMHANGLCPCGRGRTSQESEGQTWAG